jgi:hypothetical protein
MKREEGSDGTPDTEGSQEHLVTRPLLFKFSIHKLTYNCSSGSVFMPKNVILLSFPAVEVENLLVL